MSKYADELAQTYGNIGKLAEVTKQAKKNRINRDLDAEAKVRQKDIQAKIRKMLNN